MPFRILLSFSLHLSKCCLRTSLLCFTSKFAYFFFLSFCNAFNWALLVLRFLPLCFPVTRQAPVTGINVIESQKKNAENVKKVALKSFWCSVTIFGKSKNVVFQEITFGFCCSLNVGYVPIANSELAIGTKPTSARNLKFETEFEQKVVVFAMQISVFDLLYHCFPRFSSLLLHVGVRNVFITVFE